MPVALPVSFRYSGPERRAEPRASCPSRERLMPRRVNESRPGDEHPWQTLRAHDLSAHGLSFWTSAPPASVRYLWQQADDASTTMLLEVRHCTVLHVLRDPVFLVGCRVVGREA